MSGSLTKVGGAFTGATMKGTVESYAELYSGDPTDQEAIEKRKSQYSNLVNAYYDLATDFYEYAWGTSFHFAPRNNFESLPASIARHEHFLALKLHLEPGMKVLDVGCGVGGPMIEIARFSGASVTGLNNNDYQLGKARNNVQKAGLEKLCDFIKADFMSIPIPDNSFDAVYAIEATCHAPEKVGIYSEIFRILKPGGIFCAYEWALTDKYEPDNQYHNKLKKKIELGNGIPNLDITSEVIVALQKSGFDIVDYKDVAITDPINPIPWYQPLVPSWSISGFRVTGLGKWVTHYLVTALETLGIAAPGSRQTHTVLLEAHEGIVGGGQTGIFTPMFFFRAKKLSKKIL